MGILQAAYAYRISKMNKKRKRTASVDENDDENECPSNYFNGLNI